MARFANGSPAAGIHLSRDCEALNHATLSLVSLSPPSPPPYRFIKILTRQVAGWCESSFTPRYPEAFYWNQGPGRGEENFRENSMLLHQQLPVKRPLLLFRRGGDRISCQSFLSNVDRERERESWVKLGRKLDRIVRPPRNHVTVNRWYHEKPSTYAEE